MKHLIKHVHYLIILGIVLTMVSIGQLNRSSAVWADTYNQGTIPTPTPDDGANPTAVPDDDDDDDGDGDTAPPPPPPPADSATQTGVEVSGILLDQATGNPLSGITVRVTEVENMEVQTDAQGRFTLANLPPGEYTLVFVAPDDQVLGQEDVTVTSEGIDDLTVNLTLPSTQGDTEVAPTNTPANTQPTATAISAGAQPTATSTVVAISVTPAASATPAISTTPAAASAAQPTTTTTTQMAQAASTAVTETMVTTTTMELTATATVAAASQTMDPTAQPTTETEPNTMPQTGGDDMMWWLTLTIGLILLGLGIILAFANKFGFAKR